jgi:hypothetical protein
VLHFRTHLRLGFFDFALGFVEHAAFAQVLVDAADSWLLVRMQSNKLACLAAKSTIRIFIWFHLLIV